MLALSSSTARSLLGARTAICVKAIQITVPIRYQNIPAGDSEIDPHAAGKEKGKIAVPKNPQEKTVKSANDPVDADKVTSSIGNTSNLKMKQPDEIPLNARKLSSVRKNDGVNHPTSKNTIKSSGKVGEPSEGISSMYKPADSSHEEVEPMNQEQQPGPSQKQNQKSHKTSNSKSAGPSTFSPSSSSVREFHSTLDQRAAAAAKIPDRTQTRAAKEKVKEARDAANRESESHHPSAKSKDNQHYNYPMGSESEQDVAADRSDVDPRKDGDHLKQGD